MANFIELNSIEKLEELFEESNEKPVVLFKHSVTCPISSGVYYEVSEVEADVNLVIVQKARDISNAIANKTGIRHESPQAIVLKKGQVVYHASHYDITAEDTEALWREIACPILFVNAKQGYPHRIGQGDTLEHFRNAAVVDLDQAGHWAHHDQLDAFVGEAERFLAH